ncbi:MAG: aldo/keto reductase [Chloroflexota bacterium]|nr:aldo/keto reductase [Chloroflexota bacterium]MDE2948907.1 aldo/keto reductase [Chloroflexota bacterium]
MEQRTFGNTDLTCSAIGFGTWELSTTQYGEIDIDAAVRAVHMAIDHGITLFDTAEVYGPYTSEELLARGLGERRKDIVLVTKVGFVFHDDPTIVGDAAIAGRNASAAYITERTEGCLRRLNTDYIDLLLIHWPDLKTAHEETIGALEAMKAAGKIRHYGVSNYDVPMMEGCQKHGRLTANQVGYNMFDRRMESAVLPYCLENGIGFMAYGSLAFGLLTGALTPETEFAENDWRGRGMAFGLPLFQRENFLKELRVTERLKEIAARHGKSVAQLALAWVLSHPAVTVGLVGMRNERELEENIAAIDWRLSEADRAEIDGIFEDEGVPTHADAEQMTDTAAGGDSHAK